MNKIKLFETIKQVIDNWDPVGLLEVGAPKDEYDIETSKIAGKIQEDSDVEKIAGIIYDVLIEMFGEDTFNDISGFKQDCNNIAKVIFSKLA